MDLGLETSHTCRSAFWFAPNDAVFGARLWRVLDRHIEGVPLPPYRHGRSANFTRCAELRRALGDREHREQVGGHRSPPLLHPSPDPLDELRPCIPWERLDA
jgi:hypothetical protein